MTTEEVKKKLVGIWQVMPATTESTFESSELVFTADGMYSYTSDFGMGEGTFEVDTAQRGDVFTNWLNFENTEYAIEKLTDSHLFLINQTERGADKRYLRSSDITLN